MNANVDLPGADPPCDPVIGAMTTSDGPNCPMVQLLGTLAGKWAFPILYRLIIFDAPIRFGELQRSIGKITQKELTKHLRQFESLGLLTRTVYPEVPPRVEYRITDYGKTLEAPLSELARWSVTFGEPLFMASKRMNGKTTNGTVDCRQSEAASATQNP